VLSFIVLSVIVLSVTVLSVIMLSVIVLSVVMLSVVTPNVVILSVVLMNVVAPTRLFFVALCPFIKLKLRGVVKNLQTFEHCRSADSDFLRAAR